VLALVICAASHADTPNRGLQELRRFKAAEARQAVAVDAHHFYAIDNRAIGKYDKRTGERIGTVEVPAPTQTAPMTFEHEGRQYVVMAVGGEGVSASLVALRLP